MRDFNFKIIKDQEFAVLCALYGISHFFGTLDLTGHKLGRQEIYMTLYHLYKEGIIIYEKGQMKLESSMNTIFDQLKKSERMLSIVNPETLENHSFYYDLKGRQCIELQKNWSDPDCIRLRDIKKVDINDVCEENGIFPKQILDEKTLGSIRLEKQGNITKEYLEITLYDLTMDGHKITEIKVQMQGLNDVIISSKEGLTHTQIYVLDHLKTMISGLVRGKEKSNGIS